MAFRGVQRRVNQEVNLVVAKGDKTIKGQEDLNKESQKARTALFQTTHPR